MRIFKGAEKKRGGRGRGREKGEKRAKSLEVGVMDLARNVLL